MFEQGERRIMKRILTTVRRDNLMRQVARGEMLARNVFDISKVVINHDGYVVNLDDEEMISHARDALIDDISCAVKFNELNGWTKISEDSEGLSQEDISEFLTECYQCGEQMEPSENGWVCPVCRGEEENDVTG